MAITKQSIISLRNYSCFVNVTRSSRKNLSQYTNDDSHPEYLLYVDKQFNYRVTTKRQSLFIKNIYVWPLKVAPHKNGRSNTVLLKMCLFRGSPENCRYEFILNMFTDIKSHLFHLNFEMLKVLHQEFSFTVRLQKTSGVLSYTRKAHLLK